MEIQILASAKQDLVDAYHFYERQRKGIGQYYLDSLFSDIDFLRDRAGSHILVFNKFHRSLSKKFPFAIYYQVKKQTIYVYAVLDCRKNPSWIRNKLK